MIGLKIGRWRSMRKTRRPLPPSCPRIILLSAHLVTSFSRRSERRTLRSQQVCVPFSSKAVASRIIGMAVHCIEQATSHFEVD